ncbi:MAG: hypothetical protein LBV26_05030 [Bacteroidales bacterium]|jgi:hypothetical protein|nr:hypothetical protein [Bacteroidales bacterium]
MKIEKFICRVFFIAMLFVTSQQIKSQTPVKQASDTVDQGMLSFHRSMANNVQRLASAGDKAYYNVLMAGPFANSDQYFYVDTKIPFEAGTAPQIHIKGYNYGHPNKAVSLTLGWYHWAGTWHWTQYRCDLGYYNPSRIRLGTYNDAGTVRVRIEIANDGIYWTSYSFSANDHAGDASFYEDWTYHTGAMPSGTGNITTVGEYEYVNIGKAASPVTLTVAGNVGVGTTTISNDQNWGRVTDIFDPTSSKLLLRTNSVKTGVFSHELEGFGVIGTESYHDLRLMAGYWAHVMTLKTNGNVGIGTTNPTSKLTVSGDIYAREIKVNPSAGADFVFATDYRLRPLNEVETFIKDNRHLPDIAPADDMVQNGVNMGEMQIQLLQKIEELTLYLIELKKENEAQQKEIETLKQKNTNQ